MKSAEELRLFIRSDTVRASTEKGAEAEGKFELCDLHRRLIDIFVDWLNAGNKISRRQELIVFGEVLYCALFDQHVDAFFKQYRRLARQEGQRLRLQLAFSEKMNSLACIPWEYLYAPDTSTEKGFFLATDRDLVLSRYMPLSEQRTTLAPDKPPLRILVVSSKPQDCGHVKAESVIEAIQQLAGLDIMIDSSLYRQTRPTINNFLEKIAEFRPHVLHFIGHGDFNKEEQRGEIALLDDDGNACWVDDRVFTEYFEQTRVLPRLVFLHLCNGGTVDFTANYAGLAPQLIRTGIQAVIAMQYPITNGDAIAFSQAFYHSLVRGDPVDHAVQVGRWRLTIGNSASAPGKCGIPVLYMRSKDGVIQSSAKRGSRKGGPGNG